MTMPVAIDPGLVERYLLDLARYGAYGETGVWRTVYTPEWVAAQQQVAAWCAEAGLAVRRDAVGNLVGRLEGTAGGKVIASGSHLDSQAPGGRYDGALGIVGALVALRALKEQFGPPRRPLELLAFCEEESSRFAATNFWGSRAITGMIGPEEPATVVGYDGVPVGEAMRAVGLDPVRIPEARRDDIAAFIELHIEQGPLLEEAGRPLGIVTAITGLRHYLVELGGRADHAGARPMDTRRDPMLGAAEIVVGAVGTATVMGRPAVTTVGRLLVAPNLAAAVPERVTLVVDARHPDAARRAELYARHEALFQEVATRRHLDLTWRVTANHEPCPCDPGLVQLLEATARDLGIPALSLSSGAAHDTQRMATIAKVAMLFVQSQGGRSHTPAEYTTIEDATRGVEVLAAALHALAY